MLTETDILNARILIVDDQSAHVHLLERLLQDSGYTQVTGTMDPHEACALHRARPYDLILLDLQMPGLDGFGVMKALQDDAGKAVLPVIALTAQPGHKLRALQAGARDFINKPFDMVEVKLRIHHMLEVHLLYKLLDAQNQTLERTVQERTAELEDSEARFRSLTELAADWYWEQNEQGELTRGHGPVLEMLSQRGTGGGAGGGGTWDAACCQALQDKVAARQPFLDFIVHRQGTDGVRQAFRISGEPIFDRSCRVAGYRGVGTEVLPATPAG